jgi:hypothetical protein
MKNARFLALVFAISFAVACGMFTPKASKTDWSCAAYDGYGGRFPAWNTNRDKAADAALELCKTSSRSSITCRINRDQCTPPAQN